MSKFKVGDIVFNEISGNVFRVSHIFVNFENEKFLHFKTSIGHTLELGEEDCRHATSEEKKAFLQAEIEKIEAEMKELDEPKYVRVEEGEVYWCVNKWNDCEWDTEEELSSDDILSETGNYFITEAEAEKEAKLRDFEQRVAAYIKALGGGEFVVGEENFLIRISLGQNEIDIASMQYIYEHQRGWSSTNIEHIEKALEKFGEENFLKYARGEI